MVSGINHKNTGAYSLGNVWDSVAGEVNASSEWVGGCHDGIKVKCPLPVPQPATSGWALPLPSSWLPYIGWGGGGLVDPCPIP